MRRGWKILIGALGALLVLLVLNAVATSRETKPAEVTVPGGQLLDLTGGTVQVVDRGPRDADPVVLVHCFTCAIDWWDRISPMLEPRHRVVAIDLLGHGGSEKPTSGYSIENQADVVAEALDRLAVTNADVVGHSLGGSVAVALAEQSPQLVKTLTVIDEPSTPDQGSLGLGAALTLTPLIGEGLWRIKPDFSVRDGLEVAFAPGFDVPDAFIEDVKRMTYSAYDGSAAAFDDYLDAGSLADRAHATGKPLMVIMGAEEQIVDDPGAVLAAYRQAAPEARTELIENAGHSPNVETPDRTAALVLAFAMQDRLQKRGDVRPRP